jgi:hypothetical protein
MDVVFLGSGRAVDCPKFTVAIVSLLILPHGKRGVHSTGKDPRNECLGYYRGCDLACNQRRRYRTLSGSDGMLRSILQFLTLGELTVASRRSPLRVLY